MAKELQELYDDVGPPKVLQCHNGGEFKKGVEQLCRKLEVKAITSSLYHPQSQGKVERSVESKIIKRNLRIAKIQDII